MLDVATLAGAKRIFEAMQLFEYMAKRPATLLDDGFSDPLLLDGDPRDPYPRRDVETLHDLGFLQHDTGQLKLTNKAERLLEARRVREADAADLVGPDWIVVVHGEVFIDEGATPPNLRALIGGEWNPGDRIVITCHDPEYALVCHLPLALADSDPKFIGDLEEVNEDFKYADAEVDAL